MNKKGNMNKKDNIKKVASLADYKTSTAAAPSTAGRTKLVGRAKLAAAPFEDVAVAVAEALAFITSSDIEALLTSKVMFCVACTVSDPN